jgi:RNA methyltransferase, TrmH family
MSEALGPRNPQVTAASRLHRPEDRRHRSETLIEGPQLLEEALAGGVEIRSLFAGEADTVTRDVASGNGLNLTLVTDAALGRLAGTKTPRGPIAVIPIPPDPVEVSGNLLVAYGVSDPGNLGALIRIAAAFGWEFGYTDGSADPWAPKAMRGAMGGHFRCEIIRVGDLDDLEKWTTVATVVEGGIPPSQVSGGPHVVLVGEEASGLPAHVAAACDHQVTIPMPGGTESLNAAVAAGIVVYELSSR